MPTNKLETELDVAKKFTISVAKAELSRIVDDVRTTGESVVIQRRNKPAAVLVAVDEYKLLAALRDTYLTARLRQALKGELYDLEEVVGELDLGL